MTRQQTRTTYPLSHGQAKMAGPQQQLKDPFSIHCPALSISAWAYLHSKAPPVIRCRCPVRAVWSTWTHHHPLITLPFSNLLITAAVPPRCLPTPLSQDPLMVVPIFSVLTLHQCSSLQTKEKTRPHYLFWNQPKLRSLVSPNSYHRSLQTTCIKQYFIVHHSVKPTDVKTFPVACHHVSNKVLVHLKLLLEEWMWSLLGCLATFSAVPRLLLRSSVSGCLHRTVEVSSTCNTLMVLLYVLL